MLRHTLADLATALEPCRAPVWFAAHAQGALPDEARLAALQAKAHLDDVSREVARLSIEVHGGIGFTDLQGLHFWSSASTPTVSCLGHPSAVATEISWRSRWSTHSDAGHGLEEAGKPICAGVEVREEVAALLDLFLRSAGFERLPQACPGTD